MATKFEGGRGKALARPLNFINIFFAASLTRTYRENGGNRGRAPGEIEGKQGTTNYTNAPLC